MAESALELSVVVTSFNQRRDLERLIPQLCDQTLSPDKYEILVVDDGSTDGSREWLVTLTAPVRAILGSENAGRSRSRNEGILAARGELVVMIDGDHTVNRDFLELHRRAHRAHGNCAIVGKSEFVRHPDFVALNDYLNNGGATKLAHGAVLPGRYFLTRNCSVPRQLLIGLSLFDESFIGWGGEDLDLGVRIERAGIPIYGLPEALAIHHHLRPIESLLANLYRYGREGIPLLLAKHPQLFVELNLDHVLPGPGRRFGFLHRAVMRFLFTAPFYHFVLSIAQIYKRRHLPRAIFDYLHLREYSRGYRDYRASRNQIQSV